MDVIYQIIRQSAIGHYPKIYKSMVLFVFTAIVTILFIMLGILIRYGSLVTFRFGY